MRVIEPRKEMREPSKNSQKRKVYSKMIIFVCLVIVVWLFFGKKVSWQNENKVISDAANETEISDVLPQESEPQIPGLRIFTDNEFKVFYDNLLQPDLERVENPPYITGNDLADTRIRKLAEDRGYRLRSSPNVELVKVDGYPLQPSVAAPWKKLKAASVAAKLDMTIVSAYRSVSEQRQLFVERLQAEGVSTNDIAAGKADEEINTVLKTTAIPGYSKHHTGYTFDLYCAGFAFENFKNSTCNTWLAADNYKIPKELGFIPSYPPLSDSQGPEPEAWEYIYVGTELLYNR